MKGRLAVLGAGVALIAGGLGVWLILDPTARVATAKGSGSVPAIPVSIGLVTALNPILGYEKSSEIAKEALETGGSVYEIVLAKGYLSQEELEDLLKPENMTRPRYLHR